MGGWGGGGVVGGFVPKKLCFPGTYKFVKLAYVGLDGAEMEYMFTYLARAREYRAFLVGIIFSLRGCFTRGWRAQVKPTSVIRKA